MTLLVSLTLIPDLCWSYYHTFVLEAKHGFNKTTVNTWVTDHIKSYVLSMALGYPFLGGFLRIIDWAGKNFIPWLMLFIIVVQVIAIAVFPTLSE
jgi:STE24 endopeptidase